LILNDSVFKTKSYQYGVTLFTAAPDVRVEAFDSSEDPWDAAVHVLYAVCLRGDICHRHTDNACWLNLARCSELIDERRQLVWNEREIRRATKCW